MRVWGWLARDEEGRFIRGGWEVFRAYWSAAATEAVEVRKVCTWAKEQGWSKVEVQTDALQVFSRVSEDNRDSYFDLIIDDIRHILQSEASFSVRFCRRSSNQATHVLA
ncbi:unnamed protein product [Cuscuta epithymum]|uniref:RNase H type-1 domain-containing protein n=1 Tax=Cuscuta epithymum TaxID=186058 RepID=A0AAV0D446_9ASTE|nr:unnamed protein product [Cuscuta epithymum]